MNNYRKIITKQWNELTEENLKFLYFEKKLSKNQLAELFQVTKGQVSYKLKKFGLNKQSKIFNEALNEIIEQGKKEIMQQFIFSSDSLLEEDEEDIVYGPVKVVKGKYKDRIGCYDDDEGQYAIIYWGDMTSTLDYCSMIRKSYITNHITTYDLVKRAEKLQNDIAKLRCRQQFESKTDCGYEEITKMYGSMFMLWGI